MNELITVDTNTQTVSARDLHEALGISEPRALSAVETILANKEKV